MSRTPFPYPVTHYAKLYDIPLVTMYQYVKKGFPIDDPREFHDAIIRQGNVKKPNLTNVIQLMGPPSVKKSPFVQPTLPTKSEKAVQTFPKTSPRREKDESESTEELSALSGFQRELRNLDTETKNAYDSYIECENPLEKAAYWKVWKDMLEQWGKLAKIAPDAEKEAGSVARITDIEATWSRTFKEVRTMLEAIPRRMATHTVFSGLDPVDVEEALSSEMHRLMTALQAGTFVIESK